MTRLQYRMSSLTDPDNAAWQQMLDEWAAHGWTLVTFTTSVVPLPKKLSYLPQEMAYAHHFVWSRPTDAASV
jgi:hypothetical protein